MYVTASKTHAWHAALYIRLSKEDEGEGPSQSVKNQSALLHTYVQQHGISVYDTYIDDGWSGTNFERPAFMRLIADIEAKKVNIVITKDLSRLGRDHIMTGYYMERYFPEKQVRYVALLDGIDTGIESAANEITPFRAIMNDLYAKDISKKIKSVKRDKQYKGQFIGGKPMYGYKLHPKEKNKIIIDEVAADVVKRIFAMALEGVSCRKIATVLNEEGIQSPAVYCGRKVSVKGPYSGLWSSERISEMLQNETYIGNMVQGKSARVSYKSKKSVRRSREEWVVVQNTHAPLVNREAFDRVQRLLESRKHTRSRVYDYLLKGMIFCHECGYPLAVINRPPVSGEDRLFFVCRTYQRFTKEGKCTCHAVKEQVVTQAVLAKVRELCKAHIDLEKLYTIALEALERVQRVKMERTAQNTIQAEIDTLVIKLDRTYEDRLEGILNKSDFIRIYTQLKAEKSVLEQKRDSLQRQRQSMPDKETQAMELVNRFVENICKNRELLTNLIERVELTQDKQIMIYFRFRAPEAVF